MTQLHQSTIVAMSNIDDLMSAAWLQYFVVDKTLREWINNQPLSTPIHIAIKKNILKQKAKVIHGNDKGNTTLHHFLEVAKNNIFNVKIANLRLGKNKITFNISADRDSQLYSPVPVVLHLLDKDNPYLKHPSVLLYPEMPEGVMVPNPIKEYIAWERKQHEMSSVRPHK